MVLISENDADKMRTEFVEVQNVPNDSELGQCTSLLSLKNVCSKKDTNFFKLRETKYKHRPRHLSRHVVNVARIFQEEIGCCRHRGSETHTLPHGAHRLAGASKQKYTTVIKTIKCGA